MPVAGTLVAFAFSLSGQVPAAVTVSPNLADNIERPLRYRPENGDFVIENGPEFFNRPLYGGNSAFRVDAGDKPEFVLYLPGRGGNLRFALRTSAGVKWLHEAEHIVARYRPGEMLYEVRDPWIGDRGVVCLAAVAMFEKEGLVVRVDAQGLDGDVELLWAYGGANGERGRRDGDIGTENVPISDWFQLRPQFCEGNRFEVASDGFELVSSRANIAGVIPKGSRLKFADAANWNSPAKLFAAEEKAPGAPVITGGLMLRNNESQHFALIRESGANPPDLAVYREVTAPGVTGGDSSPVASASSSARPGADSLPQVFEACEAHFATLRSQIRVGTPDPFINAAVGALNVAADAVWDEPQGDVMHGAIAWRTRLLGWRGPYAMDALGWHDRARRHFDYWATRQNTSPIPAELPLPDASSNLSRSEAALHSNGDMSNSHYDMNLVYIDALFRHLLWTGDVGFARTMWPVIERHLAWERRLFRREFEASGEKLPLYEAYAAIWASDDLEYNGGGAAHASAYNYWHNVMAARVARIIGTDPVPYGREADLIARGMRKLLWTGDHFAEFKDFLGLQLVHPSAGLWTFYHAIDSGVPDQAEMESMSVSLLSQSAWIPVKGPGVPDDRQYAVLPTTDWMPYTWSINNVVMGENIHTALGLWQAGHSEDAFTLTKSALLASMFMGICPGNVGSMNYLDVYRRESQRDFADGSGVLSRAIVEGLFGIRPDALAGELTVAPGFPDEWTSASIDHPDVSFSYSRDESGEHFRVTPDFSRAMALKLSVRVHGAAAQVVVNGRDLGENEFSIDHGVLKVRAAPADVFEIAIRWRGRPPKAVEPALHAQPPFATRRFEAMEHPEVVELSGRFNDRITEIFRPGKYVSPRSSGVSLAIPSQGIGAWAGHVNAMAEIDDSGLRRVSAENGGRITMPNDVPFATPGPGDAPNVIFVSRWDSYPNEATIPLTGHAHHVSLLMAGSTNPMQSRIDNGEVVVTYADGSTSRLALRNPETWWPIDQDYFVDDYQFRVSGPLPVRVDLKSGNVRVLQRETFEGTGGPVPGGAATVLELQLDPAKELQSLTVRALANEVVIGLMAATLSR